MKHLVMASAALALFSLSTVPARAVDSGDTLFHRYCSICHSNEPGQNKLGPSLAGVFGRPSGTAPGFSYSEGMASAHLTWDEATLDKYLTDPKATVPGNKMLFIGVKNPAERQAIITYLKSLKS
ncbi:MAG TPA: cytochrome c family protein [Stellaceae bacterium]|nr:cytochrome c family protein [Stellaceae bacterium]